MNKKRMSAVFVVLLMWGLVSQVSAQDADPKFNSNADDLAKIRGVLEEYRQDIIRASGKRPSSSRFSAAWDIESRVAGWSGPRVRFCAAISSP
jgi:hypothetical protein